MEPTARKKFEEVTGYSVMEVGLVIRPGFDFCSGTPDGILIDNFDRLCTVELKCPSKCKDKKIGENSSF